MEGSPLQGDFSTRCLHGFTPREGTKLTRDQDTHERKLQKAGQGDAEKPEDAMGEEAAVEEEVDETNGTTEMDNENEIDVAEETEGEREVASRR